MEIYFGAIAVIKNRGRNAGTSELFARFSNAETW